MTAGRLGDLLPDLFPVLPGPLAAAPARERLLAAGVARLPLLSGMLLECPLGAGGGAPVGVAVRAASPADFEILAPVAAEADGPWAAVGRVLAARAADGALAEAFPEVWLEFDLDRPPAPVEPPCVFLQVAAAVGRPPRLGPHAAPRRAAAVELLTRALGLLGADFPDSHRTLDAMLDAMPASARLSYLGAMLTRGGGGCRVTLDRTPLDGGCVALARALGCGAAAALPEALGFLAAHAADAVLHLDLGPGGAGPRVGLEVGSAVLDDPAFRAAAVARGLVSPGQLAALSDWPERRHRATGGTWPAALGGQNYLVRGVNHLKVTLTADRGPWGLKAYLAVNWGNRFPAVSLWR